MRKGAAFILLSRAGVVDFRALMAAVKSGHIVAASDVFPEEPLASDHPVRTLPGFLRSAHRAGALDIAFKRMNRTQFERYLQGKSVPNRATARLICTYFRINEDDLYRAPEAPAPEHKALLPIHQTLYENMQL